MHDVQMLAKVSPRLKPLRIYLSHISPGCLENFIDSTTANLGGMCVCACVSGRVCGGGVCVYVTACVCLFVGLCACDCLWLNGVTAKGESLGLLLKDTSAANSVYLCFLLYFFRQGAVYNCSNVVPE